MQEFESGPKYKLLEDLSEMTINAFKELEETKKELTEKEFQLTELANISSNKIRQVAKTNRELSNKVDFLKELSTNLNEKNQDLERALNEVEIEKKHYRGLVKKYQNDLTKLVVREKELEIQRRKLSSLVEHKSIELLKTERKASVGELSSRLAHGLRNPLNVIKNSTELLKRKVKMSDEVLDKIIKIEKASTKISFQIDDVLEFVRETELNMKRYPLNEILDSTLSSMTIPKDIKIKRNSANIIINCDLRKMVAVFKNIISNSCDAISGKGEIKITATDDDNFVLIKIQDSGSGINKSDLTKIFDPLFTTKETGTGLGLSICQNIVEQHGGQITAQSPPTAILIRIPKNLYGYYRNNSKN